MLETYGYAWYLQFRVESISVAYELLNPNVLLAEQCAEALRQVIHDDRTAQLFINAYCRDMKEDRHRPRECRIIDENLDRLAHVWQLLLHQGPRSFLKIAANEDNLRKIVICTVHACQRQKCSNTRDANIALLMSTRMLKYVV